MTAERLARLCADRAALGGLAMVSTGSRSGPD
jgi:hypothetical protein